VKKADLDLKVKVDDEELRDAIDLIREHNVDRPNIVFKDNDSVMVTINYWNSEQKEEEVR
jgi:hypothetical protein